MCQFSLKSNFFQKKAFDFPVSLSAAASQTGLILLLTHVLCIFNLMNNWNCNKRAQNMLTLWGEPDNTVAVTVCLFSGMSYITCCGVWFPNICFLFFLFTKRVFPGWQRSSQLCCIGVKVHRKALSSALQFAGESFLQCLF